MSGDDKREPSLDALGARIEAARQRESELAGRPQASGGRGGATGSGFGLAYRMAMELVASLVVGFGLGYLLDRWLGTRPWLLIVMILLGMSAGLYNVIRTGIRMGEEQAGDGAAETGAARSGSDGKER
ncbi:MAG: AtpZ/AtpI family protein [Alphaproteobacteria bacterium]|nr:AtpZ/AtpI family protein [Alphaproteobacteria bacterium]